MPSIQWGFRQRKPCRKARASQSFKSASIIVTSSDIGPLCELNSLTLTRTNAKRFHLNVTTADSDGVSTTVSTPVSESRRQSNSGQVEVYTQIGAYTAPIRAFLYDDTTLIDSVTLFPSPRVKSGDTPHPLAATSELAVSLGPPVSGLSDAVADRSSGSGLMGRKLVQINSVNSLPTEPYGYDAVDVLIISASDPDMCRALAADERRFNALDRWMKLGGHLLDTVRRPKRQDNDRPWWPLEKFAHRQVGECRYRLPDTGPLEHYASPSTAKVSGAVEVPRLTNVDGVIDAYAGSHPTDLPLVIRSPYGFGEIAFAGVDFSQPALSKWPGRIAFLHALLHPYHVGNQFHRRHSNIGRERIQRYVRRIYDSNWAINSSPWRRSVLPSFRHSPLRIWSFSAPSIFC